MKLLFVVSITYLKQTMLLGYVVSQLFCIYSLCHIMCFYVIFFSTCLNTCAVPNMAVGDYYYYYYYYTIWMSHVTCLFFLVLLLNQQ
jgi:hypothetical protein